MKSRGFCGSFDLLRKSYISYLRDKMEWNDPFYGGRANVLESLKKLKEVFGGNTIASELFARFDCGPLQDDKETLLVLLWVNVFAVPVYKDRQGNRMKKKSPLYSIHWVSGMFRIWRVSV